MEKLYLDLISRLETDDYHAIPQACPKYNNFLKFPSEAILLL